MGQYRAQTPTLQPIKKRTRYPLIDYLATDVGKAAILDAGGTGGLARPTGQATIQVQLSTRRGRMAFQYLLNKVYAPARAIEFITQ